MDVSKLVDEVKISNQIELDEIPELDLYMDQVIQLFEQRMEGTKRTEDDKVLTKTMINNYAKGKLLMPIKNKKYSKEHLILISLIYNYKGTLSINDIKLVLDNMVKSYEDEAETYPVRGLYNLYLEQCKNDSDMFESEVSDIIASVKSNTKDEDDEYEKKLLLVSSLVNMSNMYRRLSEKIIDEYFVGE